MSRMSPTSPSHTTLTLTSANWQRIDVTTMTFPAEMLIDYVRVYQRVGSKNVGCSPHDYPTEDYINSHSVAYTSLCFFLPATFLCFLTVFST